MLIQPLSRQQLTAYQQSTARINILEGAVRSGKSFTTHLRWLDFCNRGPEGDLIICGKTDRSIKRNVILPLQEIVGDSLRYWVGKGEARLWNRLMYVVGANDERAEGKIRGATFAGALIDEATLLPESFFKMLLSRLSVPGAQLFAGTNPDSPYHWIKTDYIDRESELNLKVFPFRLSDNPSLSKQYVDEISKEYQGLWYKRYILGEWVVAEGAVYDFFDENIHVLNLPPATADHYIVGIDYGTTNPCVFVMIGVNHSVYPNLWLEKEYYYDSNKELKQKSDFEYGKDLERFVAGYNVKKIYIDPSAASFKQELMRIGLKGVVDAENEVIPGIRFMGQLISNGTYKICANCQHTLREFGNYLWDAKASQRGEDKPIKQNDHSMDAQRYALYTEYFKRGGVRPTMTEKDAEDMERKYGYRRVA